MATPPSSPKLKPTGASAGTSDPGFVQIANELVSLTVDYAKQEIRDPLTGLGKFVLWGALSLLLMGFGAVLLAIGALRALQTQTGSTFTGSLSFLPYLIVLLGSVAVLGAVGALIMKRKR